jgi:uncharacterized damage-inducible protein DinB
MGNEPLATAVVREATWRIFDLSQVQINRCLDQISDDQAWWRSNEACNSIGNVVLHLCGNVRQYVMHGIAGEPDVRQRDDEFTVRGPMPVSELRRRFDETLAEARQVIEGLGADDLLSNRRLSNRDVTVPFIVMMLVEHTGFHGGQIVHMTKGLTGRSPLA